MTIMSQENERQTRRASELMRLVSSDKTVLLLIGIVIVIAGLFTFAQRSRPETELHPTEAEESHSEVAEDPSTPESQLKEKIRGAVSADIIRTIALEYDREHDAYTVNVALNDRMEDEDFSAHAPSTKLHYELYKQRDIPLKSVTVSVYQERTNDYGSLERIKAFETQLTEETVANTINFSPAEPKVRDMIRQKWSVVHDQRTIDAKLDEKRAKKSLRSRFGEVKPGMTEEAVEKILGHEGECSKDSTLSRQAKECIYGGEAHVHYLNERVTSKEFVRAKTR